MPNHVVGQQFFCFNIGTKSQSATHNILYFGTVPRGEAGLLSRTQAQRTNKFINKKKLSFYATCNWPIFCPTVTFRRAEGAVAPRGKHRVSPIRKFTPQSRGGPNETNQGRKLKNFHRVKQRICLVRSRLAHPRSNVPSGVEPLYHWPARKLVGQWYRLNPQKTPRTML